jgi:hypothetical protein
MKKSSLPAAEELLVCRRVVGKGVVVAALHPNAGPVYWYFVDESDCNAPNYYGVTDDLDSATVFKSGYYHGRCFESFRSSFLQGISETEEVWDDEVGEYDFVENYSWRVVKLAEKAGCTPREFAAWLYKATWVEYPAPLKIHFLRDFNGFVEYRPDWSERVEDALHWSRQALADKDDLDVELARSCGHFVPISQAMVVRPVGLGVSAINHALEADCALTLDRLGVRRHRDWSQSESGVASWLGDLKETAWIHAARAGVDHVLRGEVLPVSGHIAAFPELLERFDMAVALARHESTQQQSP